MGLFENTRISNLYFELEAEWQRRAQPKVALWIYALTSLPNVKRKGKFMETQMGLNLWSFLISTRNL